MASSKLSLINNALILIGDRPLTSLTDGTRAQIVATNLYDNVVENELSKHRWGFARKKAEISKDVAAPVGNEWQTTYTLPADMITLIKLEPNIPYQILATRFTATTAEPCMPNTFTGPQRRLASILPARW